MLDAKATIQIEDERVIVTEWRFPPGAEIAWHTHKYDYIVVPHTTGSLRIIANGGETISNLVAGQSYTRLRGVEHSVINNNDYEFVVIEIEWK